MTMILSATGSWSQIGSSSSYGAIYAIAMHPTTGDIYLGGDFVLCGGVSVNCIAKWNGTSFSAVTGGGSNGVNGPIRAMVFDASGNLYVGGSFTKLSDGATIASGIAMWNGTAWSALLANTKTGVNNAVYALMLLGSTLYVGGSFTKLDDGVTTASGMASYTSAGGWSNVYDNANNIYGVNGTVRALAYDSVNNYIHIGGSFTKLDNSTGNPYYAYINLSSGNPRYSSPSNTVNGNIYAMSFVSGVGIYVGGAFTQFASTSAKRIALLSLSGIWSAVVGGSINGVDNDIVSLTYDISNSTLYVGGFFAGLSDGTKSWYFAQYKNSTWSFKYDAFAFSAYGTVNACLAAPVGNNSSIEPAINVATGNYYYTGYGTAPTPSSVTGVSSLSPNDGSNLVLSQDMSVSSSGDLTLQIATLSNLTGGKAITVAAGGKIKLTSGNQAIVKSGTIYKIG